MSKKTMGKPSSSAVGVFIVQRSRLASAKWDRAPARSQWFPRRSLDHLVRAQEQRLRYGDAERLRGFQIDHQLELGRSRNGQIGRCLALENSARVGANLAICISKARAVAHQGATGRK